MAKPTGNDDTAGAPSAPAYHRDLNRAGQLTTAQLISTGVRPELLISLALRRAAGGGVTKFGEYYFRWGYPTPSWLAGVFEQLTATGLLARAEEDPAGLQRVSLTPAGQLRYQQLHTLLPQVPDPDPAQPRAATPTPTLTPAGHADARRKSCGSVLIPITGVRYVCARPPGHTSGLNPTACTDAKNTFTWWWYETEDIHPHRRGEC